MDNQQRDSGRSGRYVPFNLSTVAPTEGTAQALGALPVLRTISPSAAIDARPNLRETRFTPSLELQARMVEMMAESGMAG